MGDGLSITLDRNENIFFSGDGRVRLNFYFFPRTTVVTIGRNENIFFTVEYRATIKFLSSPIRYSGWLYCSHNFFYVGRQPIDKSCKAKVLN